jgi:cyclic pyranopterin phosphate synthase
VSTKQSSTLPKDRFNREIDYLRISLVDHCNLRCVYCMLPGPPLDLGNAVVEPAELEMVARAAVGVGFRKPA